ncbi:MAG: L-glutamate gamma-semialdehyde dehydrogenase [Candidatus Edwardsbacteria bacterium]
MNITEFKNEVYTDFTKEENKKKMEEALTKVQAELGKEYDLIIGGERVKTKDKFKSINPSEKDEIVGVFQKAGKEEGEKAMAVALKTFEDWRFVPAEERATCLFRMANIMRRRKYELSAWMILEVGKNWAEAEADVAESIDFLDFYGREMLRYSAPQPLTPYAGEVNELFYIPLGVGVVIPPWNFPLAILTGMTSAAFVCGNTVILKPSSDSPCIAAKFMEVAEEAGVPPGVINFLTGPGSLAGEFLVGHPKTRFIAFTGSKEVGLHLVELAAKTQPGQIWIKRIIAEMGGKDTIIVDSETVMDEAVAGVLTSAFGFQGQKCSACSRVVVVKDIYEKFVDRLVEKAKNITVGPVKDPKNYMGPVINQKAMESILEYIEIGKKEGKLLCGGEKTGSNGYFIRPTIIGDVSSKARISQEEIFGPVLAVLKVKDFDNALEIANDTEYGLTGAVYSRNRQKLEKARKLFYVGNLYLNRKCTGALVGVHPFGGFNMSGTDSKAGGRDYLMLFTQAKAISEKVG